MNQSPDTSTAVIDRAARMLPARPLDVAVVGATGLVGSMMLRVLAERGVQLRSLRAFASERSAGQTVTCGDVTATVENLATADVHGIDVALFSAGAELAREYAWRFVETGAIVIDNSSAFRLDVEVPLVVPEVNPGQVREHHKVIANPNCSTIQLAVALKPIADAAGLRRVQITTMQAVSGTGQAAVEELHEQATAVLDARDVRNEVYPHAIAFNALPHCDDFDAEGNSKEEMKLVKESRKILDMPGLAVAATCVRVGVFNGHSEAVHLQTERELLPDEARELLRAAPGVRVVDDPAGNQYPMPLDASGGDEVLVGRIRKDDSVENGLALFICADNLRKGAATNAVQILELLQKQD